VKDPYDAFCDQQYFAQWDFEDYMARLGQSFNCLNGWGCDQTFCPEHRPFDTWDPKQWPDAEVIDGCI
jgi:hypothetical protein